MKKILLIIPLLSISLLFSQQREEIVERHSNGVKKIIFVYKGKGSKERLVRKLEYYDNEEIKSSIEWEKGKENGKYTFWHPNGQKFKEGTYKDGEYDGKWTEWDNSGQKVWEGNLKEHFSALEKETIAQRAVDCQAKYDESQAAYKDGNLEANIALKREILAMGCDEELSSRSQYYIGWTYGNKLFDMVAAKAEYQKGANNYISGLKYVEKCEEKLALYKKNDEAEAVYKAGDFAKAAVLREEVGLTKGCDKELAAKNLYLAGYIHQKKLNDNAKAKALYEIVVISFSGSRWVDKAKQKLADL